VSTLYKLHAHVTMDKELREDVEIKKLWTYAELYNFFASDVMFVVLEDDNGFLVADVLNPAMNLHDNNDEANWVKMIWFQRFDTLDAALMCARLQPNRG
jgi:hypothetical protein